MKNTVNEAKQSYPVFHLASKICQILEIVWNSIRCNTKAIYQSIPNLKGEDNFSTKRAMGKAEFFGFLLINTNQNKPSLARPTLYCQWYSICEKTTTVLPRALSVMKFFDSIFVVTSIHLLINRVIKDRMFPDSAQEQVSQCMFVPYLNVPYRRMLKTL